VVQPAAVGEDAVHNRRVDVGHGVADLGDGQAEQRGTGLRVGDRLPAGLLAARLLGERRVRDLPLVTTDRLLRSAPAAVVVG